MSNGGTHNELLEVPQDVPIVNVQDVPLLHDHDVVVMAISEALWGTRGSGRGGLLYTHHLVQSGRQCCMFCPEENSSVGK